MIIIRAMNPYELLWIVLLIVFVLGELATIGLTCIWFAAGALAALVMAMAGVNPVVQFLVFLVVSILLLAATRPWARKYVNAKMQRTNADSLIGENIRISERVSNMDQTGMSGRYVPVMIMRLLNREKKQKFWQSVVSNL